MTLKNNDNDQLIETMTLLMLEKTQRRQCGVLCIELMIDQVKGPFSKKIYWWFLRVIMLNTIQFDIR